MYRETWNGPCEDEAEIREMGLQGKEFQGLSSPPEAGGG